MLECEHFRISQNGESALELASFGSRSVVLLLYDELCAGYRHGQPILQKQAVDLSLATGRAEKRSGKAFLPFRWLVLEA